MRVAVMSFKGSNRDFRAWLRDQRAGMRNLVSELVTAMEAGKVVALAEHRQKKIAAKRAAIQKFTNPIIA